MKILKTTATLVAMTFASFAFAHDYKVGDLVIDHPYSFSVPATAKAGAGYFTVTNNGDSADRLVSVETSFPRAEIHSVSEVDGVAKMSPVDALEIPAGESVTLAPGGYHVMFMGVDGERFAEGQTFSATLVFEVAGEVEVDFNVEGRDGHEDHGAHNH